MNGPRCPLATSPRAQRLPRAPMRSRVEAGPALTQGTTVDWRRPRPGSGGERESASRSRATAPTLPDACSAGRRPSALLADRGYLVCLTHGLGGPCTDSAAVGASCAPRAAAEPRPRCLQGDASSESECAISASAASTMARVFAAGYLCTATRRVIATRAARPRPLPNGAPERGHRFPSPLEEQRCRPPGAECLCARGPDRAWAPDKQEGALPGRPGRA